MLAILFLKDCPQWAFKTVFCSLIGISTNKSNVQCHYAGAAHYQKAHDLFSYIYNASTGGYVVCQDIAIFYTYGNEQHLI